jgi:NAD(P) transhydrogenase
MSKYDYDVVVIGSGPAGESAAMNASKHQLKTAVIEDRGSVGGGCTHQGTIPSKTLRQVVKQYIRDKKNPFFTAKSSAQSLAYPEILSSVDRVIGKQVQMRSKFYSRNEIALFNGSAAFVDAHTLEIQLNDGQVETITGDKFIIASGARPYHPNVIDFTHPRVFDSDTVLKMPYTPRKIIIYGAGVIGCEYASIFAGLGIKVDLINNRDRLLEFLDDEISDALSYHLRDQGVMVRHREEFSEVITDKEGVVMITKSGKKLSGDALLFCNGRSGNTERLNLPAVGLEANSRGNLEVNHRYQTAVDHVFAAGDVIGWPSLASAAYDQGRSAAAAARGKENCRYVDDVPTGIYTLPEISSIGKTERELTEACVPYEIGRAFFKDTARAQISGEDVGMLKLLFHTETLELLGIHCFGAEATEIVHIGQAIMKQQGEGNTVRYFVTTTFNYPTMAEAYRIAALNGINRLSFNY